MYSFSQVKERERCYKTCSSIRAVKFDMLVEELYSGQKAGLLLSKGHRKDSFTVTFCTQFDYSLKLVYLL